MPATYEDIGRSLFEVIDYLIGAGSGPDQVRRPSDVCKYPWRLVREMRSERKTYWDLIQSILSHPAIGYSASESTAQHVLSPILNITQNARMMRSKNPREAGRVIVEKVLKKKTERLIAVPMNGFLPRGDLYTLGNAVFGVYQRILAHYKVKPQSCPPEGSRHARVLSHIADKMREYEVERLENWVCVGSRVSACDPSAAYRLAMREINTALNIIRLTLPVSHPMTGRPRLTPEPIYYSGNRICIRVTDGSRDIPATGSDEGWPMIFPPANDEHGIVPPVERAGAMAQRPHGKRSGLERIVLVAIDWAGDGIDTSDWEMKVVRCVTALEVLFMLSVERKQKNFARGVSRFFSCTLGKDNAESCAKRLYGKRSAILHGGKRNISERDAELAERLTSGCILRTLEHLDRWSDKAEFKSWLEGEGEPLLV